MDNCTILLPLKDRERYTKRFMSSLEKSSCKFKILIADGGMSKEITDLLSDSNNYPKLQYVYKKYSYDKDLLTFYKKMSNIVMQIDTPFVTFMDNDDYLNLDGFVKCVDTISNTNFISARGRVDDMDGNNMYGTHPNSIVGNSASERVLDQTEHFHGNWHNVIHTNIAQICWRLIEVLNPTNFRFIEQITSYIPVAFGNSYRGDFPWLIHDAGDRIEMESGCLQDHFPDQLTWINSSHWLENFNKMTEAVGAVISHVDKIPIDEALNEFTSAYPLKLPHLKEPLEEKINQAKSLGYNKERISVMSEIISSYSI